MAKRPGTKRREELRLTKRQHEAAEMLLAGKTQREIAAHFKCDPSRICRDLAKVRDFWKQSAIDDWRTMRAAEAQNLLWVEREAKLAWLRSQADEVTDKVSSDTPAAAVDEKGNPKPGLGGKQHAERITKRQVGDAAFLRTVIDCINRRCQLYGLDAPFKLAETTPDGEAITPERRAHMVRAILRQEFGPQVDAILEQLNGRSDAVQAGGNGAPHADGDAG